MIGRGRGCRTWLHGGPSLCGHDIDRCFHCLCTPYLSKTCLGMCRCMCSKEEGSYWIENREMSGDVSCRSRTRGCSSLRGINDEMRLRWHTHYHYGGRSLLFVYGSCMELRSTTDSWIVLDVSCAPLIAYWHMSILESAAAMDTAASSFRYLQKQVFCNPPFVPVDESFGQYHLHRTQLSLIQ